MRTIRESFCANENANIICAFASAAVGVIFLYKSIYNWNLSIHTHSHMSMSIEHINKRARAMAATFILAIWLVCSFNFCCVSVNKSHARGRLFICLKICCLVLNKRFPSAGILHTKNINTHTHTLFD